MLTNTETKKVQRI